MTTCPRCEARSQTHLCRRCVDRLRDTLRGLPRLLRHLDEAALGKTRLGDIGRHIPHRQRYELDGDALLWSLVDPLPDENPDDRHTATENRQIATQRRLLAAGGVNARARELHDSITNMLDTWMRDIAELHDLDTAMVGGPADMCIWLAHHHQQIANHPAADELADELEEKTRAVLRMINRPVPPIECGPCPTVITDHRGERQCTTALLAGRGEKTVTCWRCKQPHEVEALILARLEEIPDRLFNAADVLRIMAQIGEPIGHSTWRRWRAKGHVRAAGELYGEAAYRLSDVRKRRHETKSNRAG